MSGSTVRLTWGAPVGGCAPSSYVLQAGSSAGSSDLANANVGPAMSYVASGVGAGTYYVRVRAMNAYGQSAGSNEVVLIVTAGGAPAPVPGGVGGTWVGLAPDGSFTLDPQCPRDVDDIQFVLTSDVDSALPRKHDLFVDRLIDFGRLCVDVHQRDARIRLMHDFAHTLDIEQWVAGSAQGIRHLRHGRERSLVVWDKHDRWNVPL